MMKIEAYEAARVKALVSFEKAGIVLTEVEKGQVEVADFGLDDLERTGLELITYMNTSRCFAKELVLFPEQTCPEHQHPATDVGEGSSVIMFTSEANWTFTMAEPHAFARTNPDNASA